jgi:hypothetical protein
VLTGLKPAQRQLDLLSDPSLKTKLQLPGDLEKSSMATDEIELWRERHSASDKLLYGRKVKPESFVSITPQRIDRTG